MRHSQVRERRLFPTRYLILKNSIETFSLNFYELSPYFMNYSHTYWNRTFVMAELGIVGKIGAELQKEGTKIPVHAVDEKGDHGRGAYQPRVRGALDSTPARQYRCQTAAGSGLRHRTIAGYRADRTDRGDETRNVAMADDLEEWKVATFCALPGSFSGSSLIPGVLEMFLLFV
jgi:hypothetical protein